MSSKLKLPSYIAYNFSKYIDEIVGGYRITFQKSCNSTQKSLFPLPELRLHYYVGLASTIEVSWFLSDNRYLTQQYTRDCFPNREHHTDCRSCKCLQVSLFCPAKPRCHIARSLWASIASRCNTLVRAIRYLLFFIAAPEANNSIFATIMFR